MYGRPILADIAKGVRECIVKSCSQLPPGLKREGRRGCTWSVRPACDGSMSGCSVALSSVGDCLADTSGALRFGAPAVAQASAQAPPAPARPQVDSCQLHQPQSRKFEPGRDLWRARKQGERTHFLPDNSVRPPPRKVSYHITQHHQHQHHPQNFTCPTQYQLAFAASSCLPDTASLCNQISPLRPSTILAPIAPVTQSSPPLYSCRYVASRNRNTALCARSRSPLGIEHCPKATTVLATFRHHLSIRPPTSSRPSTNRSSQHRLPAPVPSASHRVALHRALRQ